MSTGPHPAIQPPPSPPPSGDEIPAMPRQSDSVSLPRWVVGALSGLVGVVCAGLVTWGTTTARVDSNSQDIEEIRDDVRGLVAVPSRIDDLRKAVDRLADEMREHRRSHD